MGLGACFSQPWIDLEQNTPLHEAHTWLDPELDGARSPDLQPDAYRLAFTDYEFLLRPETRGIRFQLELLKPDLGLTAAGIENTVVVYGSARTPAPDAAAAALATAEASGMPEAIQKARRGVEQSRYYADAREFARLVARYSATQESSGKFTICTGGGPGIMEAANRGAHDEGAPTVGLNIVLPHEQHCNPYVTPELAFKFHYFALRKMHFMMRAKAMVAFPGGFGTLDELFEVLTLIQTRKVKPVPVILFGSSYWERVLDFHVLVEEGTIAPQDLELFSVVDTPQAAWQAIRHFYDV